MIRLHFIGMICALCLGAGTVSAQDEMAFTIEEAQNYALDNNYDVQNARLNIKAADKQRWEVAASGFPQVSISATYRKLVDIPTQLIPGTIFGDTSGKSYEVRFGKPHNASYGISVSQLIFSGSYFVGLQASKTYMQLSQQGYKSTRLDVRVTIANTCYLILIAEENRRILQTSLDNLRKTHDEVSAMYQEGFVEETDVKQLQISVTGLENMLSSLENQIEIAYNLLKMQLGIPFETKIRLKDNLHAVLARLDVQNKLNSEFNVKNNISYKLLDTQVRLAELSLKNERTTFLPTIAAFATAQKDAQRDKFDIFDSHGKWYPTTAVGVQLTWPIFSGGQKIFKVQKARVELDQAEIKRRQAEQGLQLDYLRTRSQLSTDYKNWQKAQSSTDLAKDIYDINLEKFKEGMVTSLELIQSHNQYLQSESDYMQAVSDLLQAKTKMEKLLATD